VAVVGDQGDVTGFLRALPNAGEPVRTVATHASDGLGLIEAVFGQTVTIKEDGVERRVKADEAFLLHVLKRGIDVGGAAAQYTLATLKEVRAARAATSFPFRGILHVLVTPGSVNTALKPLRMAKKLDRLRPSAKTMLEPWIVEAALARFGAKRLDLEQQETVIQAVRTPYKVRWPDWWRVKPWEADEAAT
jgi:hypothetical protein